MSTDLERLAKAGYDRISKLAMPLPPELEALVLPWEQEPEILHEHWRECVRAILTELLDPDEGMVQAGIEHLSWSDGGDTLARLELPAAFRAMIGHILETEFRRLEAE